MARERFGGSGEAPDEQLGHGVNNIKAARCTAWKVMT